MCLPRQEPPPPQGTHSLLYFDRTPKALEIKGISILPGNYSKNNSKILSELGELALLRENHQGGAPHFPTRPIGNTNH